MSSNEAVFENLSQEHNHHHQLGELAVNYTFGDQVQASNLHQHHYQTHGNSFDGLHSVGGDHSDGIYDGYHHHHHNILEQNNLNNNHLHHSHHHNHHHQLGHHHQDLGGSGAPQYTSVIVEPQQSYHQMAHEYVH